MKTILLLLLAVPVMAVECPTGTEEHGGYCASLQSPEQAPIVKPSNEQPPSHGGTRGAIRVETPQSLIAQDAKQDQDKTDADQSGKKAANIP